VLPKALPPTARANSSDDLADAYQTAAEDKYPSPPETARADASQSMPTRFAMSPDGPKAVGKLSRKLTQKKKRCLYYAFCALSSDDLPCYRSAKLLLTGGSTYPTFIKVGKTVNAVCTRHRYITTFPEENVKNFAISERTWTAWHDYFCRSGDVRGLNSDQLHTRFEVEFKFWVSFFFISINFVLIHFM
jgi:hypothetical protein